MKQFHEMTASEIDAFHAPKYCTTAMWYSPILRCFQFSDLEAPSEAALEQLEAKLREERPRATFRRWVFVPARKF